MLKLIKKLVYLVAGLVPRDPYLWVFGSQTRKSFACNPKHLYLTASTGLAPQVRCVWISENKALIKRLRRQGLRAAYRYSPAGMWACVRAGYYFLNVSFDDISFHLSNGATVVNLWHGIPLKKIGMDDDLRAKRSAKRVQRRARTRLAALINPKRYASYDYVLSSSDYVTSYALASAFDTSPERCLAYGFPRTDLLLWSLPQVVEHIRHHEDPGMLALVQWARQHRKVFIYMPTYRDTQEDFIDLSGIDFTDLDLRLKASGYVLLVKLHPATRMKLDLSRLSHVRQLDGLYDVYPLLPFVDTLVTDYSSIYFDFLLMDKPVVFFPFDLDRYLSQCRGLYLDYRATTPGTKVYDYASLCQALFDGKDHWAQERQEVRERFWGDYQGNASRRLCERFLASL